VGVADKLCEVGGWGFGSGVLGLRVGIRGLGFGVKGWGFGVWGSDFGVAGWYFRGSCRRAWPTKALLSAPGHSWV
jgi:hypothetical protein